MPLVTRAQIRPKANLRLLIVAAALALFASGFFALNQAPSAEAAGPTQPTQSQSWYWGNNWNNNNWWGNNWYNNCSVYWYSCNNYNYNYYALPYQYSYPIYNYNAYPTYNYGYSWCGNNPSYYSYPASFTCPISPLNVQIWSPWGYPGFYIP